MRCKLIFLVSVALIAGMTADFAAALQIKINFQPLNSLTPSGYLPDSGQVFGDQGNGYSYGWDMNIAGDARERNRNADQRYDTLVQMQEGAPRTWEIELPNGGYDLFMACGDPSYDDQINTLDVEGTIVVDPDGRSYYDEYYVSVIVLDGRLTIRPAPAGIKCKIMFLHIDTLPLFKAYNPSPADGSVLAATSVSLSWTPGDFAATHNVYFGDNFNNVNDGTGDTFKGNQSGTTFDANNLIPGTTYYWRIDEVNEHHPNSPWRGDIWSFQIPAATAFAPDPPDGAGFIYTDVTLSWTAGFSAQGHVVYIDNSFDDVNNAAGGEPQAATTYTPGTLAKDTVYYWRVDEFDGQNTHKGQIWTFTTIPNIPVADPNLLCWWKFDEIIGDKVIDYSGYDHFGTVHGASLEIAGRVGPALYFGGDGDYVVDENAENYLNGLSSITVCMWIRADDTGKDMGFIDCVEPDSKDQMVTMRYDAAGASYGGTDVIKAAVTSAPPNYEQQLESSSYVQSLDWQHIAMTWSSGEEIKLYADGIENNPTGTTEPNDAGGVITGCTKLIIGKGGKDIGGSVGWIGLIDDVRIYNFVLTAEDITQVMRGESDIAWDPSPANGSTPDVKNVVPLSWQPGDFAASHDVYLGTDRNAVTNADTSDKTGIYRGRQTETAYFPVENLGWGSGPYYWRVDEYNSDKTITKGRLWQFTVADFLLIDDFEDYNISDKQIWHIWKDGLGYGAWEELPAYLGNNTGSAVGDETVYTSYVEETIVNSGNKSMPYLYNNNKDGFLKYSEAQMALSSPRNWTEENVKILTIWFRGYAAAFKEEPAGTFTMSASGADIGGLNDEFRFAYKQLSGAGSITARVLSVENVNEWAKAGVMIRRTLEPDSPFAAVYITPEYGCRFQGRLELGAEMTSDSSVATPEQRVITAPYWVKLERDNANNFYGYYSADGVKWTAMAWNPQNITMPQYVYIGLALTSHNADVVCKAQFSDVRATGTVTPAAWTQEAIGTSMFSNDPEPMYVVLNDRAVVYHDDPEATQNDTWTRWDIELKKFSDKGVSLTNVSSIGIGFGDRVNPQPGGSGKMYFDDIRLYRSE